LKVSFGWDGAYGIHFWIDPKEKIVRIMTVKTDNSNRQLDRNFESAVMQAIVEQQFRLQTLIGHL
jgi:CubicO group peptidase (beta-lactamase class C family)